MFIYTTIAMLLLIWPVSTYAQVVINEVELYPSVSAEGQWVELYNTSDSIIDLSGWTLASLSKNMTITIPQGTMLNSSSYLIINNNETWMEHKDEVIILKDQFGTVIDQVGPFTEESKDSASWQRYPNAGDSWRFVIMTPGKTNGGFPAEPKQAAPPQFTERFTITKFSLIEPSGVNATEIGVNNPFQVSAEITNNTLQKHSFAYIVQIKKDKITEHLSWVSGAIEAREVLELSQSWIPESAGVYDIEIFMWKDLANPEPLSFKVPSMTVTVQ
jgi:hypothetical protein